MAEEIVRLYTLNEDKAGTGKMVYNWTDKNMVQKRMPIPTYSVRALIGILTTIMPQPVQAIRDALIHGGTTEEMYTEEMSTILAFAMYISTPYANRKIMAYEAEKNGGQIRTIHRSTDMGQQGRRFSESDIGDLINRTVLMSFCPLICRSVPVTDKGNGYLILTDCTVEMWIGEKTITTQQVSMSSMTGRADRLKFRLRHYLCTEEQYASATPKQQRKFITEQMYNDGMSKLRYPKQVKTRPVVEHLRSGFFVQWTCNLTGQKFRIFTQSIARANRLVKCTAISGELETGVQQATQTGEFGESTTVATELIANTVKVYSPAGIYFKTLKFNMYNLFEYLFRRSVDIQENLDLHKTTKMIGRNLDCTPLQAMLDDGILNSVQKLIVKTELTLVQDLPNCGEHRDKRVEMYRHLWSTEHGGEYCKISRYQYTELRDTVLAELKELWEQEKTTVLPLPVLLYGYKMPETEVEDRTVELPLGVRQFTGDVFSSEVMVKALVKRTPEELSVFQLTETVRVRKYSEYKTVQVAIPCWESSSGQLYIEQNHD